VLTPCQCLPQKTAINSREYLQFLADTLSAQETITLQKNRNRMKSNNFSYTFIVGISHAVILPEGYTLSQQLSHIRKQRKDHVSRDKSTVDRQ
jgi:hypothetical protein